MRRPLLLLVCAVLLSAGSASAAQIYEFPYSGVLEFDPSMRSTSMAGASGAVFWGTDPNHWANPALLGYYEGVHYDDALVDFGSYSTIFEEVQVRNIGRRVTVAYGGFGVSLAGRPFDSGGLRFDF